MSALLPGYEQISGKTPRGNSYRRSDLPWRIVLHTIEGASPNLASFRSLAKGHPSAPHLWIDPRAGKRWRLQTVPLDKVARSLRRPRGAPETNHARAIQCEIAGRAAETQSWSRADVEWIGAEMVAPVVRFIRSVGGDLDLEYVERTYGANEGIVLATVSSPIRFDQGTWYGCKWVTSHQRVIANSHWDAGKLNLGLVLSAVKEALGETPPSPVPVPPPTPPTQEITVSEADRIIDHIDVKTLGLMSFGLANQKTGVIYRVQGTTAPWYGIDSLGLRVLDFDGAVAFKRMHEITENSPNVSVELHAQNVEMAGVDISDADVARIAAAVSETDADFINGSIEAAVQRAVQAVQVDLAGDLSKIRQVAELLAQVATE